MKTNKKILGKLESMMYCISDISRKVDDLHHNKVFEILDKQIKKDVVEISREGYKRIREIIAGVRRERYTITKDTTNMSEIGHEFNKLINSIVAIDHILKGNAEPEQGDE